MELSLLICKMAKEKGWGNIDEHPDRRESAIAWKKLFTLYSLWFWRREEEQKGGARDEMRVVG